MFHAKDGWYFERLGPDGRVHVVVESTQYGGKIEQTFDKDTWCSIVAAVSAKGDNVTVWRAVMQLHI